MTTIFRNATEADLPQIASLFRTLDAAHRETYPGLFQPAQAITRSDDDLRKMFQADNAVLIVAEHDTKIVALANAYVKAQPSTPVLREHRAVVIDGVVVAPQFRRQGLGTRLVHELESWASSQGADVVELNVWSFNADARALYQSLGYTTLHERMGKDCSDRRILRRA